MSERGCIDRDQRREDQLDTHLRPQTLADFVGQEQAEANLKVFIEAAQARSEALDHVLFAGPPGLGKTTLAQIVARELGVNFRATSGPVIAKAGDLAALLTNLEDRDVLFIDEIHRLNPAVEEILYPAMEDFQLDLIIGEGPAARSVGSICARSRWSAPRRARGFSPRRCATASAFRCGSISTRRGTARHRAARRARAAAWRTGGGWRAEIARRSRGTPRIAGRLLRRVRDFATVARAPISIDSRVADRRAAAISRSTIAGSMRSTTAISPASP